MAGLKEIRTRISSIRTTRQVTSAMKMVSASKLKKAQNANLQIKPYYDSLQQIVMSINASFESLTDTAYYKIRKPSRILIVLISSNRGLCGGFNLHIAKKAVEYVRENYGLQHQTDDVDFLCIGKKGEKQIKLRGMKVVESRHELFDILDFNHVSPTAEFVMNAFINGKYDRVDVVYNQLLNAAIQHQVAEQFLPARTIQKKKHEQYHDYIFEPSRESIVKNLIPKYLKIQFYKMILHSHIAEFGARMIAMHQATDNATELLKDLNLQYNKLRQASITNEINEIVGGAEALKD